MIDSVFSALSGFALGHWDWLLSGAIGFAGNSVLWQNLKHWWQTNTTAPVAPPADKK